MKPPVQLFKRSEGKSQLTFRGLPPLSSMFEVTASTYVSQMESGCPVHAFVDRNKEAFVFFAKQTHKLGTRATNIQRLTARGEPRTHLVGGF